MIHDDPGKSKEGMLNMQSSPTFWDKFKPFVSFLGLVDGIRAFFGLFLTFLCIVVVLDCTSTNSNLTTTPPVIDYFLLLLALVLLFINEGYQVALLGVRNLSDEKLVEYPKAQRIRDLIFPRDEPDRLPALFLGQSFLVILSTFLISQVTTFRYLPEDWLDLPPWFVNVFIRSGFCGVVLCVNIAQLLPSVLAQKNPQQFLSFVPFVHSTILLALSIEKFGILAFTFNIVEAIEYLFLSHRRSARIGIARLGGSNLQFTEISNSNEEDPRSLVHEHGKEMAPSHLPLQQPTSPTAQSEDNSTKASITAETSVNLIIKGMKTFISGTLFFLSLGWMLANLLLGRSSLHQISPFILILLVIMGWTICFYCEGLKIAIVSTSSMTTSEMADKGYDTFIYNVLGKLGSDGTRKFLLGRQLIVVPVGFLMGNINLYNSPVYDSLSPLVNFLLIGLSLPSLIVALQLAQLAPQVLASKKPNAFLKLPGGSLVMFTALAIEKVGITECAFVVCTIIESLLCSSKRGKEEEGGEGGREGGREGGSREYKTIVDKEEQLEAQSSTSMSSSSQPLQP